MILSLIAAVANNNVIGNDNRLIWHLPEDLKHFRRLTMHHTLIMGRKTFDSIGGPLKGRTIIILTRQPEYLAPEHCKVARSMEDAVKMVMGEKEVFIAGGEEIYRQSIDLHYARRIYLTRVYASFEGDAFFPEIDPERWELIEREDHQPDEKNSFAYSFRTYKKRPVCRNR